jgi:two-component system chemotaxis response regulator CheY
LARTTPPAKQKTILLVDDETLWLNAVRTAMLGEKVTIITATGGEEALVKLRDSRPDLILSDIRMPAMNGFDLFEKVRSDPGLRTIPYVFMSSIDDFDARNTAKTLGADGYIEKPIDVDGVRYILADLLDRL